MTPKLLFDNNFFILILFIFSFNHRCKIQENRELVIGNKSRYKKRFYIKKKFREKYLLKNTSQLKLQVFIVDLNNQ